MNPTDQPNLTDLFDQSGDTHIGQTLVRLASLAAANHRMQRAAGVGRLDSTQLSPREDQREHHGRRSGHVDADSVTTAGRTLHTEVER